MQDEAEKSKSQKRREFLKDLGILGLGGAALGGAIFSAVEYEMDKAGQKVKLLTADGKLVELDSLAIKEVTKDQLALLQDRGREGIPGKSWVMVIDLAKCRNARQCINACQTAHHLEPEQYHINTLQMQDTPRTKPYHMPKPCQHCDNPPCVSVCPVDATYKRNDGIVLIDNERCIGCRFCIAACPYSARMFNWKETKDEKNIKEGKFVLAKNSEPILSPDDIVYDVELNVPQRKGTITKCLFSADRLRNNELPYCVSACPNGVFYFGNEYEDAVTNGTTKETVQLSALLRDNGAYQLMAELGTKPRVYYLPPKNRLFPFTDSPDNTQDKKEA
jgi:molybdopterin-containing oxidoreductase family iron-sulfur binding subunit